jgi:hypothetical protein
LLIEERLEGSYLGFIQRMTALGEYLLGPIHWAWPGTSTAAFLVVPAIPEFRALEVIVRGRVFSGAFLLRQQGPDDEEGNPQNSPDDPKQMFHHEFAVTRS